MGGPDVRLIVAVLPDWYSPLIGCSRCRTGRSCTFACCVRACVLAVYVLFLYIRLLCTCRSCTFACCVLAPGR